MIICLPPHKLLILVLLVHFPLLLIKCIGQRLAVNLCSMNLYTKHLTKVMYVNNHINLSMQATMMLLSTISYCNYLYIVLVTAWKKKLMTAREHTVKNGVFSYTFRGVYCNTPNNCGVVLHQ